MGVGIADGLVDPVAVNLPGYRAICCGCSPISYFHRPSDGLPTGQPYAIFGCAGSHTDYRPAAIGLLLRLGHTGVGDVNSVSIGEVGLDLRLLCRCPADRLGPILENNRCRTNKVKGKLRCRSALSRGDGEAAVIHRNSRRYNGVRRYSTVPRDDLPGIGPQRMLCHPVGRDVVPAPNAIGRVGCRDRLTGLCIGLADSNGLLEGLVLQNVIVIEIVPAGGIGIVLAGPALGLRGCGRRLCLRVTAYKYLKHVRLAPLVGVQLDYGV